VACGVGKKVSWPVAVGLLCRSLIVMIDHNRMVVIVIRMGIDHGDLNRAVIVNHGAMPSRYCDKPEDSGQRQHDS
jgi:hypothetical protein